MGPHDVGQRVRHPVLGLGDVLDLRGSQAHVRFDDGRTAWVSRYDVEVVRR